MILNILPYFEDNYSFLYTTETEALLFDCGDDPLLYDQLKEITLPITLFITHNHSDHVGGVTQLQELHNNITVVTPEQAKKGDFNTQNKVIAIETPGHTIDHICYYLPDISSLITGDTLFAGGSGRCFSKEFKLFCESLNKISKLPQKTKLYGSHEYLKDNMKFINHLGENTEFYEQRMKLQYPSLGITLKDELQHNPFLRICSQNRNNDFRELRTAKDTFRG